MGRGGAGTPIRAARKPKEETDGSARLAGTAQGLGLQSPHNSPLFALPLEGGKEGRERPAESAG